MMNVHGIKFNDFSRVDECNRHLIAMALSTILILGNSWLSHRLYISKLCAKRIFYWGFTSFVIGVIQWRISIRNHSIATYDIPASNSVPYRSRSKVSQVFQDISSTLIVPWGLGRLVHYFLGDMVNFSSRGKISQYIGQQPNRNQLEQVRIAQGPAAGYERISIAIDRADDLRMDGYIKYNSSDTKRWFFVTLGTGGYCEGALGKPIDMISRFYDANVLVYNPPGIGESTGIPTRENLIDGYSAAFTFLQNDKKATEIISYGVSLGGMVQGMAHRRGLPLRADCKVILMEDRAPASVISAVEGILEGPLSQSRLSKCPPCIPKAILCLSGWNLEAVTPSDPLPPGNVSRVFLHPQEGMKENTYHHRKVQNAAEMNAIAAHEGLLRREDTCGYQMRSFVGQPNHHFFLTGGEHESFESALFNPMFAREITKLFQSVSR